MKLKSFFLFFWRKINSKNRKIIRDFCKDIWLDAIGANLSQMANVYGSDKNLLHGYTKIYEKYFFERKKAGFALLEIGIGGSSKKESGGGSLRMWKRYFPNANVIGIDIYDKSFFEESRIKTYVGNQSDIDFLNELTMKYHFEIVIDDGSHFSYDVITSFLNLFPKMPSKSLYIIEDTHACFFENDIKYKDFSTVTFFKDQIPYLSMKSNSDVEKCITNEIDYIHFYPKLIIIQKK